MGEGLGVPNRALSKEVRPLREEVPSFLPWEAQRI